MKMKTNKFMTYALSAMMLGSLAACSSDDSEPDNGGNSGGETTDTPCWFDMCVVVWYAEVSVKGRCGCGVSCCVVWYYVSVGFR